MSSPTSPVSDSQDVSFGSGMLTLDRRSKKASSLPTVPEQSTALSMDLKVEEADAEREATLNLPDAFISSMRVDLGMSSSFTPLIERDGYLSRRQSASLEVEALDARQRAMTASLIKAFKQRSSTTESLTTFRAEREAKMIHYLRLLGISEQDMKTLQQALAANEANVPAAHCHVLSQGSARVAQNILFPNPASKTRVAREKDLESPEQALQLALASMKEDKSSNYLGGPELVGQAAQEIVHFSMVNASHCYGKAGFEDEAQKTRVAVALRLFEQRFLSPSASGSGAEELVTDAAPLLLPIDASKRMLKQARREHEAELALANPAPQVVVVERKKARVQSKEKSRGSSVNSDSDSLRSDIADTGAGLTSRKSDSSRSPHRRTSGTIPRHRGGSPTSSKSGTPQQLLKPHTPIPPTSSDVAGLDCLKLSEGLIVNNEDITHITDWHPSVHSLFESVAQRAGRVRRLRSKGLVRSNSDSAVVQLPSMGKSASPRRGASLAAVTVQKRNRSRPNPVAIEGWRAKLPSTPSRGS